MLKVVIFFQQAARGWTQTYYAAGTDPVSWSQQNVQASTIQPFVNICANDVFITEVRASLIGSPRITYSTPFQLQNDFAFSDPDNYNQDTYGEDALLLLRSSGGIPRHLWIRGLPNQYIAYNSAGIPVPPGEFLRKVGALQSAIQTLGFAVQNANIPTPMSGLWYNVAFVESGPTGAVPNSILNCPQIPPGLTPPYPPFYFQGIPRNLLPGFPRIITPGVITPGTPMNQVYVPYLYRGPTPQVYGPKMKFTPLVYIYRAITSVAFETYGTRKTGRPTGLPRGRSSVVIRRQ